MARGYYSDTPGRLRGMRRRAETVQDPCPAFHGGPEFRRTVYYCVHDAGHEGGHKDELGNEWENQSLRGTRGNQGEGNAS